MGLTEKDLNNLALLLLILFVVSTGATITTHVLGLVYPDEVVANAMNLQIRLTSVVYYLFRIIINIGSSIWLYIQAKNSSKKTWLWAFVGLFTGVMGVILWILNEILKETKRQQADHDV